MLMPSISADEWKELVLRLGSGHAELQEVSARYIQVRAADEAAKKRTAAPGKLTAEWKAAGEEFAQAVLLYRQASDSLAALSLAGLWPRLGKSVGSHVLSLCDKWVAQPAQRPALSRMMERIHFAMMQMGQIAADPGRPKPSDLSPSARSALEASGWKASPSAAPNMTAPSGGISAPSGPGRPAASSGFGAPSRIAGVSKPSFSRARKAAPARPSSPAARLAFESASALSSAESRPSLIRPMEGEPPEPPAASGGGPSPAASRRPSAVRKPAERRGSAVRKAGRR